MESAAEKLAQHLSEHPELDLADVSIALAVGQPELEWRRAVVAADRDEAIERLRKGTGKGVWSSSERAIARPLAFVLAGVGEHVAGAGQGPLRGRAGLPRCRGSLCGNSPAGDELGHPGVDVPGGAAGGQLASRRWWRAQGDLGGAAGGICPGLGPGADVAELGDRAGGRAGLQRRRVRRGGRRPECCGLRTRWCWLPGERNGSARWPNRE